VTEPSSHTNHEQRHIGELIRSFNTPAPESLHRQIESLVSVHQDRHTGQRASNRRFASLGLASAAIVALVVVAIVVGLSAGGGAHTVSFNQAAAMTLRAATLPAPPESAAHHAQLATAVDGVPFPYWGERFGWRSTGERSDLIDGRIVRTVFYTDSTGRRIGYAILAGTPAPRVSGGVIEWRGGVSYQLLRKDGASVVTWLRGGHLCVLSGRGVSTATLLGLASESERISTS
jgi:hypothetical protein